MSGESSGVLSQQHTSEPAPPLSLSPTHVQTYSVFPNQSESSDVVVQVQRPGLWRQRHIHSSSSSSSNLGAAIAAPGPRARAALGCLMPPSADALHVRPTLAALQLAAHAEAAHAERRCGGGAGQHVAQPVGAAHAASCCCHACDCLPLKRLAPNADAVVVLEDVALSR